jgi:hypothetical protein
MGVNESSLFGKTEKKRFRCYKIGGQSDTPLTF